MSIIDRVSRLYKQRLPRYYVRIYTKKKFENGTHLELLTSIIVFYKLFYTQKVYQYAPKGSFTYGTQGWKKSRFLFSFCCSITRCHINILSYFSYHLVQFQNSGGSRGGSRGAQEPPFGLHLALRSILMLDKWNPPFWLQN